MQGNKDGGGSPPERGNFCAIAAIEQAVGMDLK